VALYGRDLRRHRTSAKEVSKALLAVRTVVEMNLQVNGVLALAIVAMKVNFVCWHVLSCITTTLNCNDTSVKFACGSGKFYRGDWRKSSPGLTQKPGLMRYTEFHQRFWLKTDQSIKFPARSWSIGNYFRKLSRSKPELSFENGGNDIPKIRRNS
jgi:hypothetical protein